MSSYDTWEKDQVHTSKEWKWLEETFGDVCDYAGYVGQGYASDCGEYYEYSPLLNYDYTYKDFKKEVELLRRKVEAND